MSPLILAIESSCDETAAAVIGVGKDGSRIKSGMTGFRPVILSNVVSSQIDLHAKTGGVVPEVASRAHMEAITPVIVQALLQAKNQNAKCKMQNKGNGSIITPHPNPLPVKRGDGTFNTPSPFQGEGWGEGSNFQESQDYLKNEITHIAVTAGPGLIGSLLIGFNAAKSIAYVLDKPIIPVNHIEGHIYSALSGVNVEGRRSKVEGRDEKTLDLGPLALDEPKFPILALVVSGGHTSLVLMKGHDQYETLGQTLDDAAGEAFDKVAKLLSLGYPGGPIISKLAEQFRNDPKGESAQGPRPKAEGGKDVASAHSISTQGDLSLSKVGLKPPALSKLVLPRPIINNGTFNFSFSGLKTAVLLEVKRRISLKLPRPLGEGRGEGLDDIDKAEIATAFEDAVVDVLVTKTMRAVEQFTPKTVVLAGGVAANKHLRSKLKVESEKSKVDFLVPPIALTGDNAAMIGLAAYYHVLRNNVSSWGKIKVDANWELG